MAVSIARPAWPVAVRETGLFPDRICFVPASLGGTKAYNLANGYHGTLSGSAAFGRGGRWGGPILSHLGTTSAVNWGSNNVILPLQGVTVVLGYRKRDATLRAATTFGVNDASGDTTQCRGLIPYSDGLVYWDFGGVSGANRLTVSGLSFGDDVWAFTTGTRGMEIWKNGVVVGSNANNPTRAANTSSFNLGIARSVQLSDLADYSFFYVYGRQLSAHDVRRLSADPWIPVRPPERATFLAAAGSAGVARPVSGTSGLVFTATGTATVARPVSGTRGLVFTAAGTATVARPVSGTASLVFTATGSASSLRPVSGTQGLVFTVSSTAPLLLGVSGTRGLVFHVDGSTTRGLAVSGSCGLVFHVDGSTTRILGGGEGAGSCGLVFHVEGSCHVTRGLVVSGSCRLVFHVSGRLKVPEAVTGDTYLGRYQDGREWPLAMLVRDRRGSPAVPTVATTATVYDLASRARVADVTIPHLRGARTPSWFAGPWRPPDALAPGRYAVVVRSMSGGFTAIELDIFEVDAGGDPAGPVVAGRVAAPADDASIVQVATGLLLAGRRPRPGGP